MAIRIAIISDTHFGVGRNTERFEDSWETAEEAFEKSKDCDLILLPGDIFDTRIPRPEDWAKSMKILSQVDVPVVAIHGNHERRGRGLINPVEGLDQAGFLKHLHCNHVVMDIKGKKIAIHGMSSVPEAYAKEVFKAWNPKPVEGAYNILMLHQSIGSYVFNPLEPPSLTLDDLPEGFDLYVSGHIHWTEKTKVHGKYFLIPGSTVTTQISKSEAKSPKGFFIVEINGDEKVEFIKLDSARKVFYKEFKVDHEKSSDINEKIDEYLGGISENKKPLVRVVVKGSVEKGFNVNFSHLKEKYRKKMFLSISSRISEEELDKKMRLLKDIREERVSIEDIGMKILRENMKEMESSFNYESIFDLLVDGNIDSAMVQLLSYSNNVDKEDSSGLKRWAI